MCSSSESAVTTSLQDCKKGHDSCVQDIESVEPPQIGVCGKLINDCWLVFIVDNSAICEDESWIQVLLFLDNSPVLADLVRSFKHNRTCKRLVFIASLVEITAALSDISDTLVRLSTEAAFSLSPCNNLANKNCLGFNAIQLFFARLGTTVSCFLLPLPNNWSRKLQRSDATDVLSIVSSFFTLKVSRSTLCNLSARRHRP